MMTFAMSKQDRTSYRRFLRTLKATAKSIKECCQSRYPLTREEQSLFFESLEVALELQLFLNRQILKQHLGEHVCTEEVLSKVESAMMRACELEEQLLWRLAKRI
jgi:hypothetical protein